MPATPRRQPRFLQQQPQLPGPQPHRTGQNPPFARSALCDRAQPRGGRTDTSRGSRPCLERSERGRSPGTVGARYQHGRRNAGRPPGPPPRPQSKHGGARRYRAVLRPTGAPCGGSSAGFGRSEAPRRGGPGSAAPFPPAMKGRGRGAGVARLQQRLEDATQVNARGWGRLRAVPAEPTGLSPPGERAAAAQPAALRGRSVRAAGGAGAAAGGSLSAGPAAQKVALGAGGEARPRPRVVLWPCPAPGCPWVSAQGRPRAALRSWEGFAGKLCPLRRAANAGSRREAHVEPSARPPRPSATSPPSNPPVTPGVPELSQRFRHPEMGGTCGAGRTRAAPGVGLAVRMPFLRREQQALRELPEEHLAFTSYIRMLQYVGGCGAGGGAGIGRDTLLPRCRPGLRPPLWAGRRIGSYGRATAACAQPCCWAPAGAPKR